MKFNEMICVLGGVFMFLILSIIGMLEVTSEVEEPYMDEIFHIPQAQKYCDGRYFEWDDMITTLPGLYVASVTLLKPLSWLTDTQICTLPQLRSVNILAAVINLGTLWKLTQIIHCNKPGYSCANGVLNAFTLAFFPVLYFFTFLFYTDSGSTTFVLLSYLFSLQSRHVMSASFGVCAVLFRQTNIMWVVFCAASTAIDVLLNTVKIDKRVDLHEVTDVDQLQHVLKWIQRLVSHGTYRVGLQLIFDILKMVWPYICVVIGFVVFVFLNGGIVVGAKHDHEAGLHIVQLLYFAAFTVGFAFVHFVTFETVKGFTEFMKRHWVSFIVLLVFISTTIWRFTYAHRYLLADNRHYTFYIWARIIGRNPVCRYLPTPAYCFCGYALFSVVAKNCNIFWRIAYTVCLSFLLIPSTLLEFRYFIAPYIILRLHIPLPSRQKLLAELAVYAVVNIVTLYLFLERPFKWEAQSGLQRFMW